MTRKELSLQTFEMLKDQIFDIYEIDNKDIYDNAPNQFKEAIYCKLFGINYYFKKY